MNTQRTNICGYPDSIMAIGCTQSAYGWWPRNSDEVTIGYNKIYQMANSQFARAYSLTTEYKHKLPVWLEY